MADHHHHHHHGMEDSTESTTVGPNPMTTAATILQTVMSTVMSSDPHHHHHSSVDAQHAGHQITSEQGADAFSDLADVHSRHVSAHGDHPMQMFFHFGVDTVILFKEWTTSTTTGLLFSVIGIIILSMLYEGIKFFREYLFKKYFTSLEYSSVSVLGEDGKPVTEVHKVARNRMLSWPHLLQTSLHIIQMVLSYFLMLIFMTYNVWLCLAIVIGAGVGYFLFGWRKATVVDITEHCH